MNQTILLSLFFVCLMTSCTVFYRTVRYGGADIDDYNVFPTYDLNVNEYKFHFTKSDYKLFDTLDVNWDYQGITYHNLDSLLENTSTRAFLIIKNDSIIYENYFRGYKREDISTVFSVSKSVTSLLIGIAIDEGYISSVNDPVTKYISELKHADPMFDKLTIKDLLDMRSGIKFNEDYSFNPFSKIARLYYGRNQFSLVKRLTFECEPGTRQEYQSISTAILGIVIEKATKQNFAKYFDDKVWKPLAMENTAKWSLDDKKHQSAKAYGGLSISAIDLAKIGQLYLNDGKYNNTQIVSAKWVEETLTPNVYNDGYQSQWYSFCGNGLDSTGNKYFNDSITAQKAWQVRYAKKYPYYEVSQVRKVDWNKKQQKKYWSLSRDNYWKLSIYTNQYYALGIMKQILFIDPAKKTIIVRLGDRSDFDNYTDLLYKINKKL
ncbi:serine hydrolase domain-containing protein [Mangrovibacterium diazotrophicum]|uniref:CubicO group peptidase (Beta-lactamase class C family) n=1 Tax=Mangrovibacterium diazotrophicum TaxID=1261403 RepID=A0A419W4W7_9BACT|nr:serine hydrolase [Mangrovibacterium diazotrophicum]RKD90476.1 CubicO group peptidase (beta-lactamase class C family) [Mangrovibacterium diazotrophicum]